MNRVTETGRMSLFNRAFHDDIETGSADRTLASVGDLADVLVHRFGLPQDPSRIMQSGSASASRRNLGARHSRVVVAGWQPPSARGARREGQEFGEVQATEEV